MPAGSFDLTTEERGSLQDVFHKIRQSLLGQTENSMKGMAVATKWLDKIIKNNVSKISHDRILVSVAYKKISIDSSGTLEPAFTLDWCLEVFYAANAISDNIMDGRSRLTVTGTPTWHTVPDVGMIAVNDALTLTLLVQTILKNFFRGHSKLLHLLEDIFADALDKRVLGRGLYEKLKREQEIGSVFSLRIYRQIVDLTFSYIKIYVPVRFALTLAKKNFSSEKEEEAKKILLDIGYYWKIKNDYSVVFEHPQSDVLLMEGDLKLNWFFVKAIETVGKRERDMDTLQDCVKSKNIANLEKIYEQEGILKHFDEEKKILLNSILHKINILSKVDSNIKNLMLSLVS